MSYIIKMALDIKARFEPPAPMTSPLEAYCAIGTIAKAMKFKMPAAVAGQLHRRPWPVKGPQWRRCM